MDNTIELCELSSESNGARILFSTDDFFGIAENLINEVEPNIKCSHPDAWLTRRKRRNWKPDFTIIQLAARAEIYFISVDTIYLTGNIPVQFSVQASQLLTTDVDTLEEYQDRFNRRGRPITNVEPHIRHLYSETWPYLISWQTLNSGYPSMSKKFFMIPSTGQDYTHLRLNIFPDGGISRLSVYGKVLRPIHMPSQNWLIDLVSNIYGGNCIAYSSCYNNTHPNNMIKPGASLAMQDGWQTARSRFRIDDFAQPFNFNQFGEEWAIFQLGYSGKIASIKFEICSQWDKPYVVRVQGLREGVTLNILNENDINNPPWQNIIPYTFVTENFMQQITAQNQNMKMAYVKLSIKPNGYISRFRVLGEI